MTQNYENVSFLHAVLFFARKALAPVKAAHPTWKFEIKWGAPADVPQTGASFPSNPPASFAPNFSLLVALVNLFRSGHNVYITAGPNVSGDASKTFGISEPQTAASAPPIPYDPVKPLPSPSPGPACWPCLDTILIA